MALDFSAFYQPTPNPVGDGLSGLGNVMSAIIQRRQAMELEAQKRADALAQQRIVESRERDRMDMEAHHWDAEQKRLTDAGEAQREIERQRLREAQAAKFTAAINSGDEQAARMHLAAMGGLPGAFAQAPAAGGDQPPPTALPPHAAPGPADSYPDPESTPAGAPGAAVAPPARLPAAAPIDPVSAAIQQAQAQKKARAEGLAGELEGSFPPGPVSKAVAAETMQFVKRGHLGSREEALKWFGEERKRREEIAGQNFRAAMGAGREDARLSNAEKRLQIAEATPINTEITKATEDVIRKGGLRDQVEHLNGAVNQLDKNPSNPVVWTNAIDGMIKTNTGRAAIKAQYDLYTQHAHGAVDNFDTWVDRLRTGLPSTEQRKNLRGAMDASLSELREQAGNANRNLHDTYDSDPRVQANPYVQQHYRAVEHGAFGRLPGYAQKALSPEDKQAVEWARANPGDPRAKAILEHNGVRP